MPNKRQAPPVQARRTGLAQQPLAHIEWIERQALHANGYNPNHVAPAELLLLKISLLEDGWTQPIVARRDCEIVDGFHRWTVSGDPAIAAMTGGLVPVVFLPDDTPLSHQMMATIRHNRARGTHGVVPMAEIVRSLLNEQGLSEEEVMTRLGMEWEEVDRLRDKGNMKKRGARASFNTGWVPEREAR